MGHSSRSTAPLRVQFLFEPIHEIDNRQQAPRFHLSCASIMHVVREIGQRGMMLGIVPTLAQSLPVRAHPLVAVLNRLCLSPYDLKVLSYLEKVVVAQDQAGAEEPVVICRILS